MMTRPRAPRFRACWLPLALALAVSAAGAGSSAGAGTAPTPPASASPATAGGIDKYVGGPVEAAKAARPRELSAAERAAVELVALYLEGGPEAWWPRLAAGSALQRLGHAAALAEIAARVGPPDGATWQLLTPGRADPQRAVFGIEFASGLDETVTLGVIFQAGAWRLAEIRTTSDPLDLQAALAAPAGPTGPAPAAPEAPAAAAESPAPAHRDLGRLILALALIAVTLFAGIGAVLLFTQRDQKRQAIGAGAAAGVLVLGLLGWGLGGLSGPAAGPAAGAGPFLAAPAVPFGSLAPLRAALATGADRADIERRLAAPPGDRNLRQVQDLWKAQYLLGEGKLAEAEALLSGFPQLSTYPLTDLLRARLAFRRLQREETGWLYDKAGKGGLDNDGLRLEAAFAKAVSDDTPQAEVDFRRMVAMGSRLAEPWYVEAQIAASQDRMEEAETYLRQAWKLEPTTRAELFRNPLLALLVARPTLFSLFQLDKPDEGRVPPEAPLGSAAPGIALPAGAQAATCGQNLRLVIDGAGAAGTAGNTAGSASSELLVPGGAFLAPAGATLEDADTWRHYAEAKAVAAIPALTAQAVAGGALPPRLLRSAERAARSLAEEHRWRELVALTDPLVPSPLPGSSVPAAPAASDTPPPPADSAAPAELVHLRAFALHQVERDLEARQLLINLAKSDIASHRPATASLFDLAELLAAAGEYDSAIKLIEKADAQLPEPRGTRRRKQFALDRDLAASYASYRSEHFEIRFPKATGEHYAKQVAWVLEEERTRLQRWIPKASTKRIEVHLFPIKDFYASFGGDVAVIGIFDGKMRVPFADLKSLQPQLVAVLSHELAHALIADLTHGQAPHWIQEGIAQHIEMGTRRVSLLPDLAQGGHALSVPTLEPILSGFAEEQLVGLAYGEAAWLIYFIETRYGAPSIPRLLNAYAAGRTTPQAVREVLGVSLAELDRAFWAWGTGEAPPIRTLEARRYDQESIVAERRQRRAEVPHLGMRVEEAAFPETPADEHQRKMVEWHGAYRGRTASIQRDLKPVLKAYKGSEPVGAGTAIICSDLYTAVRQALADAKLWASPDAEVNNALRDAYGAIADLGKACATGKDSDSKELMGRIDARLHAAAQRLAPYGLTP